MIIYVIVYHIITIWGGGYPKGKMMPGFLHESVSRWPNLFRNELNIVNKFHLRPTQVTVADYLVVQINF